MATNCQLIEEHAHSNNKCPLSATPSLSSMTHEEKQDSTEKMQSDNSLSEACSSDADPVHASSKAAETAHKEPPVLPVMGESEDVFENAFEASLDNMEEADLDGYETDSESGNEYDDRTVSNTLTMRSIGSEDLTCSSGLGCSILSTFPRSSSFECYSSSDSENEEENLKNTMNHTSAYFPSDLRNAEIFHTRPYLLPFVERRRLSQCKEEDEDDGEKSPQPHTSEMSAPKFERAAVPTPPPPPPPMPQGASAEKFKDLERLRQQFMQKIDNINTGNVEDIKTVTPVEPIPPPPPPPIPPTILPPSLINLLQSTHNKPSSVISSAILKKPSPSKLIVPTGTMKTSTLPLPALNSNPNSPTSPGGVEAPFIVKGKFTVIKALEGPLESQTPPPPSSLRTEAKNLQNLQATSNAHTISFPSSFGGYSSVQGLFSQRYGSNKFPSAVPHLSKQFFDSSLVEIRTPAVSSNSLNSTGKDTSGNCDSQNTKCDTSLVRKQPLDEVWIKRMPQSSSQIPKINNSVNSSYSSSNNALHRNSITDNDSLISSGRNTAAPSEDVSRIFFLYKMVE